MQLKRKAMFQEECRSSTKTKNVSTSECMVISRVNTFLCNFPGDTPDSVLKSDTIKGTICFSKAIV